MFHVGDAESGCDHRRGELRDVVHDQLRAPALDDLGQVVRPRLELDADEELREEQGADAGGRKRGKIRMPAGELVPGVVAQPGAERGEPVRGGLRDDRLARSDGHGVSGRRERTREWQQRTVVTSQRPAGQERAHEGSIPAVIASATEPISRRTPAC